MREIKIGKIYKHFKGKLYIVLDIVNDVESSDNEKLEKFVIYQALYGENLKWARSYNSFSSQVDKSKYPEINQKYRFEEVVEVYEK